MSSHHTASPLPGSALASTPELRRIRRRTLRLHHTIRTEVALRRIESMR